MCTVFVRKNGWSLPLHPRQVVLWICLVCLVVIYYGVFVHFLPFTWRIVGIVIGVVIFVSHVISHVITVSIDPGESHVRCKSDEATDYYCEICQVNVFENTKHCKRCNKCVEGIDHHCLWLNTCIGSRNYRPFMVTLVTGFLMVILFAVFGFVLFVLFYDSPNKLCYSKCSNSSSDGNLKLFGGDVPDEVFITITGIVTLISWIIAILLCHLLAFHIYFIATGTTTYGYIMKSRHNNQRYPFLCCICPKKKNRVTPLENGGQANGDWVTSLDDDTASHETVTTSHDT